MIEKGQKQNVDKSAAKFSDKYLKMTEKKKVFLMPKMEKKKKKSKLETKSDKTTYFYS